MEPKAQVHEYAKFSTPISIAVAILVIGIVLKIMHWPFSEWFLLIGSGGLAFFYLLRFLSKPQKVFLDYVKLSLVIAFSIRAVVVLFHLPGKIIVSIIFLALLGLFVIMGGMPYLIGEGEDSKTAFESKNYAVLIKSGLVIVGATSIVLGAIFKIMHWPGAGPLLVVGLVITAAWAIVDLLFTKK